jgi:hypothetical protein
MLAELEAGNVLSILFWVVVTIAALIGGYVVVMRLREWLRGPDVTSAPIGFTLSDLRKLHASGQMTDEEFEKARAKAVEAAKKMMERPAKKDPKDVPPPNFPDVNKE